MLLLFLSASKCKNTKNIPCPTFADIRLTIRALENLHISANGIPVDRMNELIAMCHSKPSMKVLCEVPFKDKTITKLDVSGKNLGVEGALVVNDYLENNGALASLNLARSGIGARGAQHIASALPQCK